MTKTPLPSLEITRLSVNLPPGVMALCADEQTRRDCTPDMHAVWEARARMIIRHSMYQHHRAMRRAQYR
jgi:hypothetical protein